MRPLMLLVAVATLAAFSGCQLGEKAKSLTSGWSSAAPTPPPATDSGIRADGEISAQESAKLTLHMAAGLEAKGQDAEAAAHYEKARQLDPSLSDRCSRRLAVLYDKLDNQAQAMIEFQQLLKKFAHDADLLCDLGYSYYNRGQWVEAEKHLREALKKNKEHKRSMINLGLALAQQGRDQEALETWMKCITPAEAYANLGFVLLTQKKTEEAKAAYREALRHEPALQTALQTLAKLEGSVQKSSQ